MPPVLSSSPSPPPPGGPVSPELAAKTSTADTSPPELPLHPAPYARISIRRWSRSMSPSAQANPKQAITTTIAAAGQPRCSISQEGITTIPRVRGRGHLTEKEEVIALFNRRHYSLKHVLAAPPPSRPAPSRPAPPLTPHTLYYIYDACVTVGRVSPQRILSIKNFHPGGWGLGVGSSSLGASRGSIAPSPGRR